MPALIDTPEAANRLARAIASDLSLYNEAKIKEGIENDTFFSVLQEEIAEGRAHYQSRVDPKIPLNSLQRRGVGTHLRLHHQRAHVSAGSIASAFAAACPSPVIRRPHAETSCA